MRPEFIVEKNGEKFCKYAGLLEEAHKQGLVEITTHVVQLPHPDNGNVTIVHAHVVLEKDGVRKSFDGIGDAGPNSVKPNMVQNAIRMSETRAKSRGLRDAINSGAVCLEELDDPDGATPVITAETGGRPAARAQGTPAPAAARKPQGQGSPAAAANPMSDSQKRMLESLAKQAGETVSMAGMTVAQASAEITRLKAKIAAAAPASQTPASHAYAGNGRGGR